MAAPYAKAGAAKGPPAQCSPQEADGATHFAFFGCRPGDCLRRVSRWAETRPLPILEPNFDQIVKFFVVQVFPDGPGLPKPMISGGFSTAGCRAPLALPDARAIRFVQGPFGGCHATSPPQEDNP